MRRKSQRGGLDSETLLLTLQGEGSRHKPNMDRKLTKLTSCARSEPAEEPAEEPGLYKALSLLIVRARLYETADERGVLPLPGEKREAKIGPRHNTRTTLGSIAKNSPTGLEKRHEVLEAPLWAKVTRKIKTRRSNPPLRTLHNS
jgi:hypothetical protein